MRLLMTFAILFFGKTLFAQGIDLHTHLFLELGTPTWFYKGSFFEPLQATSWSSLRGTKSNEKTLLKSNLDIVVASLHAVSTGPFSIRDSIRAQIKEAQNFTKQNPSWIIATTPAQALGALKQKKHVLVLSLEGAEGTLENDDDIDEFVKKGPI